MITEDYVSFETAKLLKEKGFDENCFRSYVKDKLAVSQGFNNSYYITMYSDGTYRPVSAPTLQMAMKWLREEHRLHISAEMGFDVDNHQYYFFAPSVCRFSDKSGEYENPFGEKEFDTYEEACEAAIRYCLENLI